MMLIPGDWLGIERILNHEGTNYPSLQAFWHDLLT